MSKYLVYASYTNEGIKGLMKDRASGRKAAVDTALASVGGSVEAMYFCFGNYDAVILADVPDNVSAAAVSLVASSSGLARVTTTPLLTIEEIDRALEKAVQYSPPGG